jgi:hypothetical protein
VSILCPYIRGKKEGEIISKKEKFKKCGEMVSKKILKK